MNSKAKRRAPAEVSAEIIAALMWGPKTTGELVEYVGIARANVWRHRRALAESGVVHICDWRDARQAVYALQPKPFALTDAPKPAPQRKPYVPSGKPRPPSKFRESMSAYMASRGIA